MKLSKALEVFIALSALGTTKLPAKTGYRVAKAINAFKPDVTAYEEQRMALAKELGKPSEDGTQFLMKGDGYDNLDAFNDQLTALLEEEVDITFPTITPDDLGNAEVEPIHLAALDGVFIKEKTDGPN